MSCVTCSDGNLSDCIYFPAFRFLSEFVQLLRKILTKEIYCIYSSKSLPMRSKDIQRIDSMKVVSKNVLRSDVIYAWFCESSVYACTSANVDLSCATWTLPPNTLSATVIICILYRQEWTHSTCRHLCGYLPAGMNCIHWICAWRQMQRFRIAAPFLGRQRHDRMSGE